MFNFEAIWVLLSLTLGNSGAELRAPEDSELKQHLTGSIRIKRHHIPDEVVRCISRNYFPANVSCSPDVTNWNDIHCVNNSLGMYAAGARFVTFGSGPFGVNFNPFAPRRPCNPGPDPKEVKIEGLIVDKAKLQVNATFLMQLLKQKEDELQEFKTKLEASEKLRHMQDTKIEIFRLKVLRWQEGTIDCQGDMIMERNKSSVALQIASAHIEALQKENDMLEKSRAELMDTVSDLQTSLDMSRNTTDFCRKRLFLCKTHLDQCLESESRLTKSMEEESQTSAEYTRNSQKEQKELQETLNKVRVSFSECTASLDETKLQNNDLRKARDECIGQLSKEEENLHFCEINLHRCRANYSITVDITEHCRNEKETCSKRSAHLGSEYRKCVEDKKTLQSELHASQRKRHELSGIRTALIARLSVMNQTIVECNNQATVLIRHLDSEKAAHSDTKAKLTSCNINIGQLTSERDILAAELNEAKGSLEKSRAYKANIIKENNLLQRKLFLALDKRQALLEKLKHCGNLLIKFELKYQVLGHNSSLCHAKLQETHNMYDVVLEQRNACYSHNNKSIHRIDRWKKQYLTCSDGTAHFQTELKKCSSDLATMNAMYTSLREENDMVHNISQNLHLRLKKSADTVSHLTVALSTLEIRTSDLDREKNELTKALEDHLGNIRTLQQNLLDCRSEYNDSLEVIVTLKQNSSATLTMLGALKDQSVATLAKLVDAQTALSEEKTLRGKTEENLSRIEYRLKTTLALYVNEHNMKTNIAERLRLCTINHTEVVGEAQVWQRRLAECQDHLADLIHKHQQETERIQSKLETALEVQNNAEEITRENKASLARCEGKRAALEGEKQELVHKLSGYRHLVHVREVKIHQLLTIKMLLTRKLDLCLADNTKCTGLQKIYQDRYKRCDEDMFRTKTDLEAVNKELEQCNANCHEASLSCPAASRGEVYINMGSGCLLQTHHNSSLSLMKKYCDEAGGQLVTLSPEDHALQKDIFRMLEYSETAPRSVWVIRPGQSSKECFSVDMSKVKHASSKDVVEFIITPCDEELPGLCMAKWTKYEVSSISPYSIFYNETVKLSSLEWSS